MTCSLPVAHSVGIYPIPIYSALGRSWWVDQSLYANAPVWTSSYRQVMNMASGPASAMLHLLISSGPFICGHCQGKSVILVPSAFLSSQKLWFFGDPG